MDYLASWRQKNTTSTSCRGGQVGAGCVVVVCVCVVVVCVCVPSGVCMCVCVSVCVAFGRLKIWFLLGYKSTHTEPQTTGDNKGT